ncbi:MAG: hypothetical protein H2184_15725 [Candidatus Galacturonibacter soehngenii]|nr:hypothetical protein [Candidatus Galacturonibacter soehngenii]
MEVNRDEAEKGLIKCNEDDCQFCYYGLCHHSDVINGESECEYSHI